MISGLTIRVEDCEDLSAVEEELNDLVGVVHKAVETYCKTLGLSSREDGSLGYIITAGPVAEYGGEPHDRDGVRVDTGRAFGRVSLVFHD